MKFLTLQAQIALMEMKERNIWILNIRHESGSNVSGELHDSDMALFFNLKNGYNYDIIVWLLNEFMSLSLCQASVKVLPSSLVSFIQSQTAYSGEKKRKASLDQAQNRSTAGICLRLGRLPSI